MVAALGGTIPAGAKAATYNLPRKAYYVDFQPTGLDRVIFISARNDQAGTRGTTCVRVGQWRNDRWEEEKGCGTTTVAIDDLLGEAHIVGKIPSEGYIGTTGDITQRPTGERGEITIDIRGMGTGTPAQNVVNLCGSIIPTVCTGSSVLDRSAVSDGSLSAPLVGVTNYSFSEASSWLELLTLR